VTGYWFEPSHEEAGPGLLEDKRLPLRRLCSYRIRSDYEGKSVDEHHLGGLMETVKQVIQTVRQKKGGEQMPEVKTKDKSLAEAVAKFVDALHHMYPGIKIKPIASFEDEDFTFEIAVPGNLSIGEVLEACHKQCIKVEDEYDLFILPHVIHAG
jgi:hypothetical protein